MTALIFDCDGVLAETERHGHLPAFNQTFAEFGLPVRWSEDEYGELLRIGGGKERVASVLTPAFVARYGLPSDPDGQREWLAAFHERKTTIYKEAIGGNAVSARPGVRRVVEAALARGWKLAVASTSAEASVRAVLDRTVSPELAARFAVFAGDVVSAKKPDPAIYLLAIEAVDARPEETIVIEDSRSGLLAAVAAGLTCVITVSSYTVDEDFTEAALVVSSLGDPDEPTRVLADRCDARPGALVTVSDLEAVLEHSVEAL